MRTLQPAVVTDSTRASCVSLPSGHRRAEAGQHKQRVVDPDADPDQAGDRRGPVGDVDHSRQQRDQAGGGDAEADQGDRQRQPHRDDRAEGDQQHDRGAEEADALRARLLLGGVDRVAAELDADAPPLFSSAASISFSPPSSGKSQPATVIGSVLVAIVRSSETRIGVWGRRARSARPR